MVNPQLRFVWVLLPALMVGGFEYFRHHFFKGLPVGWGNFLAAFIASFGSVLYYWITFELIRRLSKTVQKEKALQATHQERLRIARELHDNVLQTLFFLNVQFGNIRQYMAGHELSKANELIAEAQKGVQTTYEDIRKAIYDLSQPEPDGELLSAHLERLIKQFQEDSGLPVHFHIEGPQSPAQLSPMGGRELTAISREALRNIQKHALAEKVDFSLRFTGQATVLEITDDGVGFDPDRYLNKGFGLQDIKDRVKNLAGTMQVKSRPGRGTTLTVRIPNDGRGVAGGEVSREANARFDC